MWWSADASLPLSLACSLFVRVLFVVSVALFAVVVIVVIVVVVVAATVAAVARYMSSLRRVAALLTGWLLACAFYLTLFRLNSRSRVSVCYKIYTCICMGKCAKDKNKKNDNIKKKALLNWDWAKNWLEIFWWRWWFIIEKGNLCRKKKAVFHWCKHTSILSLERVPHRSDCRVV